MLDFDALREKQTTLNQLAAGLTPADLHRLTDEMVDAMLAVLDGAIDADVTFVPEDPAAYDRFASDPSEEKIAWTLGHVVVHATASAEEAAALSSVLARGIEIKERSRSEVPWREVTSVAQLRQRLEESRRMRHAFLNAWPDSPHYDQLYVPTYNPAADPMNAVGRFILGLYHDFPHLRQMREDLRQARAAREAA
jgi:hypothetical protein